MTKSRVLALFLVVAGILAAATCRSTNTIVARVITPVPAPAETAAPPAAVSPPRRPTASSTPMAVATAAPSIYDRTPGVLYEQTIGPTPTATAHPPVGEHRIAPPPVPPVRVTAASPRPAARPSTPADKTPSPEPSATPPPSPTATPTAGAPFRPTWTEPPTLTPAITFRIVTREPTSAHPSPTHKPGAYYEPSDYRPAVTWTPTPDRRR